MTLHYRNKDDILYLILEACSSEYGVLRTHLMFKANLAYYSYLLYTQNATRDGLIEFKGNKFYITNKGLKLLGKLTELRKLLKLDLKTRQLAPSKKNN